MKTKYDCNCFELFEIILFLRNKNIILNTNTTVLQLYSYIKYLNI